MVIIVGAFTIYTGFVSGKVFNHASNLILCGLMFCRDITVVTSNARGHASAVALCEDAFVIVTKSDRGRPDSELRDTSCVTRDDTL